MSDFVDSLFRQRPIVSARSSTEALKRDLRAHDLVLIGLGNIVGGGIYILFGIATRAAGPAVTLSFLATGVAATCSALCYAEFAARIPEAGSAYVFTYQVVGEFFAWHVAWAMFLEMVTGSAAVSVGWSNYTRAFLEGLKVEVPWILHEVPFGGYFKLDLMALGFLLYLTSVVAMGISESKWMNHIATCAKMGALVLVVILAFSYADVDNWNHFSPNGSLGIIRAAATVMFAYTGFEVVAQCAEEAKDPDTSLPIGIVGSVVCATLFYALVSASVTLMVPWESIDVNAPLALAFSKHQPWMVPTVSAAAVVGLFAIGLGNILASSRLLMGLGRDGLLPRFLGKVNQSSKTPVIATFLVGGMAATMTFLFPYSFLTEMVSVGTMFAFTMVCIDLIATRAHDECRPAVLPLALVFFIVCCFVACLTFQRSMWTSFGLSVFLACSVAAFLCCVSKVPAFATSCFTVPFGTAIALIGISMNIIMTTSLEAALEWNVGWFAIGWIVYFGYGRQHSILALPEAARLVSSP